MAPIQPSKHIFNLHHDSNPTELSRLPPLLKHLLMCFAWLIDQNFNSVAPENNLAQPLMKYCRYLKMTDTEFSTSFTATVDLE